MFKPYCCSHASATLIPYRAAYVVCGDAANMNDKPNDAIVNNVTLTLLFLRILPSIRYLPILIDTFELSHQLLLS